MVWYVKEAVAHCNPVGFGHCGATLVGRDDQSLVAALRARCKGKSVGAALRAKVIDLPIEYMCFLDVDSV